MDPTFCSQLIGLLDFRDFWVLDPNVNPPQTTISYFVPIWHAMV